MARSICCYSSKTSRNQQKTDFSIWNFRTKICNNVRHQQMKHWESSEMRFPKVWWLYGPCSRGKLPFEVSRKVSVGQALSKSSTRIQNMDTDMFHVFYLSGPFFFAPAKWQSKSKTSLVNHVINKMMRRRRREEEEVVFDYNLGRWYKWSNICKNQSHGTKWKYPKTWITQCRT